MTVTFPMPKSLNDYLHQSVAAINASMSDDISIAMNKAIDVTVTALRAGKPLLTCGNGGSAADASHIAGELVGRFFRERKPYNVISLCDNSVAFTAIGNDYSYEEIFSKQVQAYGQPGAVLIGITTSGNSKNVLAAMRAAKEIGMTNIAFTGEGGGKCAELADVLLAANAKVTPIIQQVHECWYHYFCMVVEEQLA